jgi:hypothetical protein
LLLAAGFTALELATAWTPPYGLFHDELYYWAGARRPGLGYVDHPPLAPWVLTGATAVLGDGRLGFRLVPALCCGGVVLLTGLIARSLGAASFGQLLAGLAAGVMPYTLVLCSFYSVNALEILLWTAACFLLARLIRTGDDRLWLGLGAVAGLGLLNKHTFGLLAAGLGLGILATPHRARLRSGWLWMGAALALLLALPNLVWNALNDWPSLAFYRSRPAADLPAGVLDALELQILGANPGNLLIWVPGLLFLLLSGRGRAWRPLGIAFLALFAVILFSGHRRADRIAGIYPVVLAAGATFWDGWTRSRAGMRIALTAALLAFAVLVLPASLPLLSPRAIEAYFEAIDEKPEIEITDVGQALPLHLAGRLWAEPFAEQVLKAWQALPVEFRSRAVVLAPHWVFASAIEYYGRHRELPPVVSPHNAYWFWREEAAGRDVALAVAIPSSALAGSFAQTHEAGSLACERCASFGRQLPLVIASGPVRPLEQLLFEWRTFSIEAVPQLRR